MVIVIAAEGDFELVEDKAAAVFGITFGFFDFSNHTVVHGLLSFVTGNEKGTQEERAFQYSTSWMSVNTGISVFTLQRVYDELGAESTG
ncbi:MAG: hypothetical protein OHK0010_25980 [Anaerolineales bacterium]